MGGWKGELHNGWPCLGEKKDGGKGLRVCMMIPPINKTDGPPNPTQIPAGLKAQGKYVARTLSFTDTTFAIKQVPMAEEFRTKYDALVDVW